MKQKNNARQRREAEVRRRKEAFFPVQPEQTQTVPAKHTPQKPVFRPEVFPERSPEEEAREFLEYLDRYGTPAGKDDLPIRAKRKKESSVSIPSLNLEAGMPTVEEAISRMNIGIQEIRMSRVRAIKLIHGYGSTGRGGKICTGVRNELTAMKKKKLIRDFIPGEEFGPADAAARRLAELDRSVTKDPDYGRINQGITIVIL